MAENARYFVEFALGRSGGFCFPVLREQGKVVCESRIPGGMCQAALPPRKRSPVNRQICEITVESGNNGCQRTHIMPASSSLHVLSLYMLIYGDSFFVSTTSF